MIEKRAPVLSPSEFRDRLRIMHEVDRAEWREHWRSMVLHAFFTCGGGFLFGLALGLAAVVQVFDMLARV